MAIAFDNAASLGIGVTNNQSGAYVVTGTNPLIIGWARDDGVAGTCAVNAMTYGGVSMTQITGSPFNYTSGGSLVLFILPGPATGSNTLAATTGSTRAYDYGAISWSGCAQTGQPDNARTHSFSGTALSEAITTVADNCWAFLFLDNGTGVPTLSATTNAISRLGTDGEVLIDSNGAKTPAGAFTQSATLSINTSYGAFQVSLAPFVAVAASIVSSQFLNLGVG